MISLRSNKMMPTRLLKDLCGDPGRIGANHRHNHIGPKAYIAGGGGAWKSAHYMRRVNNCRISRVRIIINPKPEMDTGLKTKHRVNIMFGR